MSLSSFFGNHRPSGVETVAPISILPDELLLGIFENIQDEHLYIYPLYQLASVCKRWCTIIVSTPTFFRTLSTHSDSQTNALIIEKNRYGPLDVRISTYYEGSQKRPPKVELSEFTKECCRHAARWEGVDISIVGGKEIPLHILQEALVEAIRLKSYAIRTQYQPTVHLPHPTLLRRLSVDGPILSLSMCHFQNLRYLSLAPHDRPAILEQLPNILRTTLKLEELHLKGRYLQAAYTNEDGSVTLGPRLNDPILSIEGGTPIPLNYLKVLRVSGVPPSYTRALLDSMVAPALELLMPGDLEPNAIDPVISPNCRVLLACVVKKASRIVVDTVGSRLVALSSEEFSPAWKFPEESIPSKMGPSRGFKILVLCIKSTSWEKIGPFLETVQDIPLHVKIKRWGEWFGDKTVEWPVPSNHPDYVFRRLPWAAKLTLYGDLQPIANTLHDLGNEDTAWFLPQLKELEVYTVNHVYDPASDAFILDALKSVIHRRDIRSDEMRIEKLIVQDAKFAKALKKEEIFNRILDEEL